VTGLGRVVRSGIRRRRVQTVVIGLVSAAAVTASVLGAGLLVASRSPFDAGFTAQHGAHLSVVADPQLVTQAQLIASKTASGVTDAAGPYPVLTLSFTSTGTGAGAPGPEPAADGGPLRLPPLTIVGRSGPGGAVDRVEVVEGRWPTRPDEIVVAVGVIRIPPGVRLQAPGGQTLTVVGTARSMSATASAWVLPSALDALTMPGATRGYQMLYRFAAAGTGAEVDAGRAAVEATLPPGAVTGARSWLDVRQQAVEDSAVFVPFLVAFAVLGLVMAVLIVGTVIAGAVGAATRRIGVLKALGATPAGVVRAFVAQALVPSAVGAMVGTVAGNLLALPVLAETEQLYGSANTTIAWWVSLVVPGGILAVVAVTAWAASLRAARLRTVDALTVGRGADRTGGRSAALARAAGRLTARMPMSRPVGLGAARPFTRPVRAAAILLSIAAGTASVTFALGLGGSLIRIQTAVEQNTADVVIEIRPDEAPPGGGTGTHRPDPADVLATIAAQEGTRAAYGLAQAPAAVAGLTDPVSINAFTGDPTWDGFTMVSGRWFTGPGEAVAGEAFLRATGARVGDTVTVQADGTPVRLRIAGEVFDTGTAVFTGADTIAAALPLLRPHEYRIALTDGTDPGGYAKRLTTALRPQGLTAYPNQTPVDPLLVVVQGLTATLTLLLVAVAALGVFNMLVLDLRERVHELAVQKALGMTPRQTIAMVVASVTGVGLVGGLIGVPVGVAVQHLVLPAMAAGGGLHLPDSFVDVYGPATLVPLTLGGLVIALLGALLPAGWAARTRTAVALRTE